MKCVDKTKYQEHSSQMNGLLPKILILGLLIPNVCLAFGVPTTYTLSNFFTSYQDEPASFARNGNGDFFGVTKTGKEFSQVNVTTTVSVRLQKFSIDEAYFYISSIGIIDAKSDLEALSIYLSNFDMTV